MQIIVNENNKNSSAIYAGRYWAVINSNEVVGLVAMNNPLNGNFDEYRQKVIAFLTLLGTPKAGVIEIREGKRFFLQRLTHVNRGKHPRQPKIFPVYANTAEPNNASIPLGSHWGALRGKSVMAIIANACPVSVDEAEFERAAKTCLELQGVVISGQLLEESGCHFLMVEPPVAGAQQHPNKKYPVVKPRKNFIK